MDKFTHDRIIIGMVLSLGIAHTLKGIAKLIEHPSRTRSYWVHLLWVAYLFILITHFWWWEFRLGAVANWGFTSYFFVIVYTILIYLLCAMLFPEDMKEYAGFKEYYYSRGAWFFGLLAFTYLMDFGDAALKGSVYLDHLGTEYAVSTVLHFILCLLAIRIKKPWFHSALAIVFIVYGISWILRKYAVQ